MKTNYITPLIEEHPLVQEDIICTSDVTGLGGGTSDYYEDIE